MFKFCPECGVKLDKEFKFCPECGIEFEKQEQKNFSADELGKLVICENCGEENSAASVVCRGCGVRLKNKEEAEESENKIIEKEKHNYKNRQKKVSSSKSTNQKVSGSATKTLSKKKLYTITAVLFIAVILLLIFSGIFDAKKVQVTSPGTNQIQSSGVDLNNLQKINELEARVKANPNDKETLLALAHLKNDSGLYEQAIINYKQYLQLEPKNADARVDMGVCYYNLGDFKTAISEMEKALKYKPDHQIAFLNLGIVNLSAGNLEKSKEWLKKAVNQNPNNQIGKRAKELLDSHTK